MKREATIRDLHTQIGQIQLRTARGPRQIRITAVCPSGLMFESPIDDEGKSAVGYRSLTDGGPSEILIHPDDWEQIVRSIGMEPIPGITPTVTITEAFGIPVLRDPP